MQDRCASLEERLRQVEMGQAAAMAAATDSTMEAERGSARNPLPGDDLRLPSAVMVGGIPVATNGDLVYLGGGLYAAAAVPEKPQPKRQKVLPGRAKALRPLGLRSAVRSASAHLVGPQSGGGDCSPCPSRAQSDGQLGGRPASGMSGSTAAGGHRSSEGRERKGPQGWRPAGVQKLPPAPEPPAQRAGHHTDPVVADGPVPTGSHSEARADHRRVQRREGVGLFGQQGLMHQLREGEEMLMRREQPPAGPVAGPPLNGDRRAAERKAAKEARINQILQERQDRIAAEAAAAQAARMERHASAPALPSVQYIDPTQAQDRLDKQKMRLACKMEMLDFFNAYRSPITKMTAEQTRLLLAKLHGDVEEQAGGVAEAARRGGRAEAEWPGEGERGEELPEGSPTACGEQPGSIQQRLQQFNDACNRAFEIDEDPDLDIAL